jgi:DNA-binding NarL/FixJ family response regulator
MSPVVESGRPIRVLIVDDQLLVRSGFTMMLSVEDDIEVVGDVANGELGVAAARELAPDVILMDVQMPVMDGIEATRAVVAADLGRVVILTTFDRDDYLFDALQAGASGFLLKNADPEQLVDAIRAVADGHALLAPEVTTRVIAAMTRGSHAGGSVRRTITVGSADQLARLTDREREVLSSWPAVGPTPRSPPTCSSARPRSRPTSPTASPSCTCATGSRPWSSPTRAASSDRRRPRVHRQGDPAAPRRA